MAIESIRERQADFAIDLMQTVESKYSNREIGPALKKKIDRFAYHWCQCDWNRDTGRWEMLFESQHFIMEKELEKWLS